MLMKCAIIYSRNLQLIIIADHTSGMAERSHRLMIYQVVGSLLLSFAGQSNFSE